MVANTYKGLTNGTQSWDTGANWAAGVPGTADDVQVTLAGTYTVQLASTSYTVNSITVNPSTGTVTLSVPGSGALTATNGISITNGVLSIGATGQVTSDGSVTFGNTNSSLSVNGGALTVSGTNLLQLGTSTQVTVTNSGSISAGQILGGSTTGTTINLNAGVLTVVGNDGGQATYNLTGHSTITYDASLSANNVYNFQDTTTGNVIVIANAGVTQFTSAITGFGGNDSFDLASITYNKADRLVTASNNLDTLVQDGTGATLFTFKNTLLVPTGAQLGSDSTGNLIVAVAPCFANGTLIATPTGGALVEDIAPGDSIVTADGRVRPVKWVGQRYVDLRGHRNPAKAAPIRIVRGAFGEGRPVRDLLVSPDHAIWIATDHIADEMDDVRLVGGALIPAEVLVNGATVYQDTSLSEVTYYHVELDSHDVLLAEGLTVESYLDAGNRALFNNPGLAVRLLHPEFTVNAATEIECAPLLLDGPVVASVKRALLERAETTFGVRHVADPDLRIIANGRWLAPLTTTGGGYRFALPRGASSFRIVSRAAAPSDVLPTPADRRVLGVAIAAITLSSPAGALALPIDHPALNAGWHAIEAGQAVRWTDGDAVVPFAADIVDIRVAATLPYREQTAEAAPRAA